MYCIVLYLLLSHLKLGSVPSTKCRQTYTSYAMTMYLIELSDMFVQITDKAGMCMELGCFLAGLVVSSQGREFSEKVVVHFNQLSVQTINCSLDLALVDLQRYRTRERPIFCSVLCIYR